MTTSPPLALLLFFLSLHLLVTPVLKNPFPYSSGMLFMGTSNLSCCCSAFFSLRSPGKILCTVKSTKWLVKDDLSTERSAGEISNARPAVTRTPDRIPTAESLSQPQRHGRERNASKTSHCRGTEDGSETKK